MSKNGNDTFVYAVSGSKEQLEAFKAAQGNNYREAEDGTPLWFTTRCVGQNGSLVITSKGNVIADTSAYKQAASLCKQYGGNFGQELAKAAVANLLGGGNTADASVPASTPADLGGM